MKVLTATRWGVHFYFILKDSLNIGFYCTLKWHTATIETDEGKRVKITSWFIIHNITECY